MAAMLKTDNCSKTANMNIKKLYSEVADGVQCGQMQGYASRSYQRRP